MPHLKHALLIVLMTLSAPALSNESAPFRVVQDWFAATAAVDIKGLKDAVTTDFELLEGGEIWGITKLAAAIKRGEGRFERRNFFKVITQKQKGDMVWISYWNKGKFTANGKSNDAFWLESIVLVKVKGQWKIQMLHSSHLGPDKLPKDVVFEEYVNINSK